MFSKIIFALAMVCVVNASVITVNILDGNPGTELASNPKDCNFRACDQLCRRLKFPGGACVNGRCKCDNFLNAEDEVSKNPLSEVEELVSLKDDMTEHAEHTSPDDCNFKACAEQCFRLGFTGGACVNGRCKCDNFLNTEVSDFNIEDTAPLRACNNKQCNQLCRKKNFRGGACLGANCYCHKFLSLLEDTMTDSAESLPLSSCNSIACDDQCRRTGWHSGVCINGQCKCDYFLNTEDAVTENTLCNLEDSISPRRCTYQACNKLCRRLQFSGGACVNGRCKCDNFFGTEDAVDEYSEFPIRVCRLTKCNRKCTRRGYEVAKCVNGRCNCYNKTQAEGEISETSLPVSELLEDQSERGCNMQACDQLCRRLKFSGGACVNGRCKCDNFFRTEVDAVDEYSELATRRICNLRQCNRTCTRRGYEGARCVNGWCKCYNKIHRQDASPLNDVTSDENDESNVILRTNEEETIEASPRVCNTVTCNQMCHRLNYAGGWCRFGQCQCY